VLALSAAAAILSATTAADAAPPSSTAGSASANGASSSSAAAPAAVTGRTAPKAGAKTATPLSGGSLTAHQDGACNDYGNWYGSTGDLCLWYLSNFVGSSSDFYSADNNLWNNYFLTPGWGQGQTVANNAESDWNYDSTYTAWVCTGVDYTGVCGYIPPDSGGNFSSTFKNNVESLYWAQ